MNEQMITAMKADWLRFCDQNCKDDGEAITARVATAPKKPARRWIWATSLVAAAAAVMLVCLPLVNEWRDVAMDKNSGGAPMAPDGDHYNEFTDNVGNDGDNDVNGSTSTTLPTDDNLHGNDGAPQPTDDNFHGNNTTGTTAQTTPSAPDKNNGNAPTAGKPTTGTADWEGQGGGYGGNHVYVNGEKHLGENFFNYYLYKEFTEDDTKELDAEIAAETNGTHYAYTGASLQRYILALNIPREKIEELNQTSKEFYAGHKQYDRLVFTDEEINDMYTLTREEYNKKYKAPTAAIIGSVLYPFNWFVENPVEVWMQHPFALEQIQEVFENGKKANFPEKHLDEFEKKLNDYIAALAM